MKIFFKVSLVIYLLTAVSCTSEFTVVNEEGEVMKVQAKDYDGLIDIGDTLVVSTHTNNRRPVIHSLYKGTVPPAYFYERKTEKDTSYLAFFYHKVVRVR